MALVLAWSVKSNTTRFVRPEYSAASAGAVLPGIEELARTCDDHQI
jgi:hypothetical protein